jgi:periplasmic divalent cation tolerance protein
VENAALPCLVLTTWPADVSPEPLARALVEQRLAACVHVLDAGGSTYRWEGTVETARERQVMIKTTRQRLAAVDAYVRAIHPYAVPEWLVLDAGASADYAAWLADSVAVSEGGD